MPFKMIGIDYTRLFSDLEPSRYFENLKRYFKAIPSVKNLSHRKLLSLQSHFSYSVTSSNLRFVATRM
jgi:hypothetical protein